MTALVNTFKELGYKQMVKDMFALFQHLILVWTPMTGSLYTHHKTAGAFLSTAVNSSSDLV